MRISTSMIFDSGRDALLRQSGDFLNTQLQLASGKRVNKPSDDPIAASRSLEVSQSKSANEQLRTNQGYATDALRSMETKLGNVSEILTYIRTRAVQAGNGALSPAEHRAIATDIEAQFNALVGIANSKDATGEYQFSGYRSDTPSFTVEADGTVRYQGDEGERSIQVGSSRTMAVAEPGSKVFMTDASGASEMFGWISDFIGELRKAPTDPTRDIPTAVGTALDDMDRALDNVSSVRASVGSRMVELDALGELSADHELQYAETLSRLQDLDYTEAISRFSKQQTILEAAQQSYVRVTGLSLFALLR